MSASKTTTTFAKRRHGMSRWLGFWSCLCLVTCWYPQLAGAQNSTDPCTTQTSDLNQQIDYQSYLDTAPQPVCNGSVCTNDVSTVSSLIAPRCQALGGNFYVFNERWTCDNDETGGRSIFSVNHVGTCVGTSCTQSWVQSLSEFGLANTTAGFAVLGLTNCNSSIESLTLATGNLTVSLGGSNTSTVPTGGNSPTAAAPPAPSPVAGNTPVPSPAGTFPTLLSDVEQCQKETNKLDETYNFTGYYFALSNCLASTTNRLRCYYDYTTATAKVEPVCKASAGKFYEVYEVVKCDDDSTNGTAEFSYGGLGLCFGASCSLSTVQAILDQQVQVNETQGSDGSSRFSNCVESVVVWLASGDNSTVSAGGGSNSTPPSSGGVISPSPSPVGGSTFSPSGGYSTFSPSSGYSPSPSSGYSPSLPSGDGSSVDFRCEQEINNLNDLTNYNDYYSGIEPTCSQSGNDLTCSVNYNSLSARVASACITNGGIFYLLDERVQCHDDDTGGTFTVTTFATGLCAGPSCSQTYLRSGLNAALADTAQGFTSSDLSNCVTSVEITMSGGSSPLSPSSSGGGSSPFTRSSGGMKSRPCAFIATAVGMTLTVLLVMTFA